MKAEMDRRGFSRLAGRVNGFTVSSDSRKMMAMVLAAFLGGSDSVWVLADSAEHPS